MPASVCQSCAREDEPLHPVKRVYVQPEAWDAEPKITVVDEIEWWCVVCLDHYPHEPAPEALSSGGSPDPGGAPDEGDYTNKPGTPPPRTA